MTVTSQFRLLYGATASFLEALENEPKVHAYLYTLRLHDEDTYEHSCRVGLLSVDLGYENDFGGYDSRLLGFAGLLHDIGKTRIPQQILSKKASLDLRERKLIGGHPRLGFLELNDSEYETVRQIVVGHHEYKKDPYPRKHADRRDARRTPERRNSDERVSVLTQIVAVSDIYDALLRKFYDVVLMSRLSAFLPASQCEFKFD